MNDFDYDCMQKKRIAQSARHRKGTVRGPRGCRLPSDYLTPAQIKRLSSKGETYTMNRPMRYEQFKAMPDDLKREYLDQLLNVCGGRTTTIADMMGVSDETVRKYLRKFGLRKMGPQSRIEARLWNAFIAGGRLAEAQAQLEEKEPEPAPEHPNGQSEAEEAPPCSLAVSPERRMQPRFVHFQMRGALSIADIASAIAGLPVFASDVLVTVSIDTEPHDNAKGDL